MTTYDEKQRYYKINKVFWRWKLQDGNEGCQRVYDVSLSFALPPPDLPTPPAATMPLPPRQKRDAGNDIVAILSAPRRLKVWLETPDPPKPPKPALAKKPEVVVPPFDIQEIPGAMRKEFMPVSAKLMERWFAGALNYSPTRDDERAEINQNGQPYPPSMIDKTTIKLDWILGYPRAKTQYEALLNHSWLTTPKAVDALAIKSKPFRAPYAKIDAWALSGKDIATLHRHFQFQFVGVGGSPSQKFDQLLSSEIDNDGVPDDLTGSLGSFNIYASIAHATFDRDTRRATISSVFVYVKDNYTFTDNPGQPSQYLGHWSRDGVIIVPATGAAELAGIPWPDYPVSIGNARVRGNVHYAVRNSSFREWQKIHRRGGDFIVYSDYRVVTLSQPIEIVFL